MSDSPTVGITMGDPAGIGPEIIVNGYRALREIANPLVIGDAGVIDTACAICESDLGVELIGDPTEATFAADQIPVLDLANIEDLDRGIVDEIYGQASLEYIERGIELALEGKIDAITTAPINKQATALAGSEYAGHTDMLADYTDTESYSMMLIEEDLRVSHVSTHVPLKQACNLVSEEVVLETIRVTNMALTDLGVDAPTIAIAGLNPHASDGGVLGETESKEIEPAVSRARKENINAFGPESPDTVYVDAARGAADCVVSMYHDQGHIPIKMLGFQDSGAVSGVNVTIGLPIVRTSVDHGTAFDIAGEGVASEASLIDAVEVAADMASTQNRTQTRGEPA